MGKRGTTSGADRGYGHKSQVVGGAEGKRKSLDCMNDAAVLV